MAKGKLLRVGYSQDFFYKIKNLDLDYHCKEGVILKDDLIKNTAVSKKGVKFRFFDPFFYDYMSDIKRGPQIPLPKDLGFIIASTGIGKNSVVVDSGSGSGYLTCSYANIVKKVYSFDVKKENLEIAKKNSEMIGLENIEFKELNIYDNELPIAKETVDLVSLDVPEPKNALKNIFSCLKHGGFLSIYVPCITQVSDFVDSLDENYVLISVNEILNRNWLVQGKKVRPDTRQIGHSGFIVIVRKL